MIDMNYHGYSAEDFEELMQQAMDDAEAERIEAEYWAGIESGEIPDPTEPSNLF